MRSIVIHQWYKVFSTLINSREFDPRLKYGTALKLIPSIYPLNQFIKCVMDNLRKKTLFFLF